ncbi:MAG: hemerythrin domain-containing protein [Armatimonadota bacterium]|nr:hemerythrin domain-containing protein [bacterium]
MKSTDILSNEHRAIEIVLDAMEKSAKRLESGDEVDLATIDDCLDFAIGFADKCHHAKEEELLFPKLVEAGVKRDGGPVGAMLHEHEEGRSLLKSIRKHLDELSAGDEEAKEPLAEALKCYANLLRSHIIKEDRVLFEVAAAALSDEEDEELVKGFDDIEERKIGPGVHEEYHRMLDDLAERVKMM